MLYGVSSLLQKVLIHKCQKFYVVFENIFFRFAAMKFKKILEQKLKRVIFPIVNFSKKLLNLKFEYPCQVTLKK